MKRRNWLIAVVSVFVCLVIGFGIIIINTDLSSYDRETKYTLVSLEEENKKIDVYLNENFNFHNTGIRDEKIKYIVIHYTGNTGTARAFIESYNNWNHVNSSADFFVDFNGDIYQYNRDIDGRYAYAVGGERDEKSSGGSYYKKCTNENSISIEMCVGNKGVKSPNSKDWYFNKETINSTIDLVEYLMKKYNVEKDNIIRHYDVSGKYCPGVVGWNKDSGSESEWEKFLSRIK